MNKQMEKKKLHDIIPILSKWLVVNNFKNFFWVKNSKSLVFQTQAEFVKSVNFCFYNLKNLVFQAYIINGIYWIR